MLYFNDNAEINLDEIYTKSISEIDKFRSRNYIYKQELSIDNIFNPFLIFKNMFLMLL